MTQLSGSSKCRAAAITASTPCTAAVLTALPLESTSAGRFLLAARSVNGNGTRMTCQRSKATVGFLVFARGPLRQRAFDGLEVLDIQRLHPAYPRRAVVLEFPDDGIARRHVQGLADIRGNGRLALGGDLGNGVHGMVSLR